MNFQITSPDDFSPVIEYLGLSNAGTILVKPNWVGAMPGGFTDAKIIDYFLEALKGKKVIFIEGYSYWRTDKKRDTTEDYFSSKEASLETGKKHWDFFKEMDEWFLNETGIADVLKSHHSTYISTTDEIWSGRGANSEAIRSIVEEKFTPVQNPQLYEGVPQILLDLKGAPLVSLSKAKIDSSYGASLSIKNIYGLIPDPNRFRKYHGEDDNESLLTQSIVDIHKIYQSLFDLKFIVESVFDYCRMNWDTEKSEPMPGNNLLIAGTDGAAVDEEALSRLNANLIGPMANLLSLYKKEILSHDK